MTHSSRATAPAIETSIGWSTADDIFVRGYDLSRDLIGNIDLAGMTFLILQGRKPDDREARMLNALIVTIVEHGITPSVIAARMTYLGAPEALQGAVAAGILGAGSVYLGAMEDTGKLLVEALDNANGRDEVEIAREVVAGYKSRRAIIPGIGHPIHTGGDPRVVRLFDIAGELGFRGKYVSLLEAIVVEASKNRARPFPINAAGAIGALSIEMGFDWRIAKGLAVIGRTIGLVGHIAEEIENPWASNLWAHTEDIAIHPQPR